MTSVSCYWCAAPANTREHVPPKCIFPELGDAADGTNHREQLLTVPSCPQHNLAKSSTDEYLLCVLAMSILNNPVGHAQATTKVLRALKRSPGLAERVLGKSRTLLVEDTVTGQVDETIAFKVDDQRIGGALEHIARGIHFHHFGERWPGKVQTLAEFLLVMGAPHAAERNERLQAARDSASALFTSSPKHGSNPGIFFYQALDDHNIPAKRIMRFSFYDGTKALALFIPEGTEPL